MMPPVSLPLKGGTGSAHAGAPASIPHTATRHAAPIIRIADSISPGDTLFAGTHFNTGLAAGTRPTLVRIAGRGKNGGRLDAELSPGVAALHLTLPGLPGTVRVLDHVADYPCAASNSPPSKSPASKGQALNGQALARHWAPCSACLHSDRRPRRPIRWS